MRERRVGNEKQYLEMLAAANPEGLAIVGWERQDGGDVARVTLLDTPAYRIGGGIEPRHEVRLVLPEYFPSTPIEAYLERPVAHPNVHPENGFVCLWARHAPGDTVIEAVLQLQRVIAWRLWNSDPDQVMQPGLGELPPLPYTPLRLPEEYAACRVPAPPLHRRPRLSPPEA
jgi:hypothetical protein